MTTEMHRKLPLRCEKSKKNYEEELPRSLPRHLSQHPTLHLIPHPSVYTIAENSTQDVSKCTVFRSEVKKFFGGGGKAPSPHPFLSGERIPPPHTPHPSHRPFPCAVTIYPYFIPWREPRRLGRHDTSLARPKCQPVNHYATQPHNTILIIVTRNHIHNTSNELFCICASLRRLRRYYRNVHA